MILGIGIAVAILVLFGLDRLALATERRGWIYYRHRRASPGGVGNALLEVQALIEPRVRATVEARQEPAAPGETAADPPSPGRNRAPRRTR